jgi:pyrophosphatase PpaX
LTRTSGDAGDELALRIDTLEAVLFDLDGTLIDTVDLIRTSMRYATEKVLGEALPDDVLMRNVGVPLIVQMDEFAPGRAEELVAVYREHNARVHDEMVREYEGVTETLDALVERGLPLGIVTSKSGPVARRGLDLFGLAPYFETIVSCDDVTVHKPDPHPLRHAAQAIGVAVERCVYVGDSPHDMSAAVAAGCVSVAALWGAFPPERVLAPGPTHWAECPRDVQALLCGEEARFRTSARSGPTG